MRGHAHISAFLFVVLFYPGCLVALVESAQNPVFAATGSITFLFAFVSAKSTAVALDPKSIVPKKIRLTPKEYHELAWHRGLVIDERFIADPTVPLLRKLFYLTKASGPGLHTLEPFRSLAATLLADLAILGGMYLKWEVNQPGPLETAFSAILGFGAGGMSGFGSGWFVRWFWGAR